MQHIKVKLHDFIFKPVNFSQASLVSDTTEAVVRRCSVKRVFLKISQNSQENTYDRASFLITF